MLQGISDILFSDCMDSAVKADEVALQTCLFPSHCAPAEEEPTALLHHSEVQWPP